MKKALIKYLCVGSAWLFLVAVAWIVEKFNDIDATFFLVAWLCFFYLKRDYERKIENNETDEN